MPLEKELNALAERMLALGLKSHENDFIQYKNGRTSRVRVQVTVLVLPHAEPRPELLTRYDEYFTNCEKNNKIPRAYADWAKVLDV